MSQQAAMSYVMSGDRAAGTWEFPGGKVDPGEAAHEGLIREIQEEVGLRLRATDLQPATFALKFWEPTQLLLPLFVCRRFQGTAAGLEGQEVRWVTYQELVSGDYAMMSVDESFRRWLGGHVDKDGAFEWERFESTASLAQLTRAADAKRVYSGAV